MLQSVAIEGYRGILEGRVEDLPRLGVLVGPNGAGKSSVLEALLIGAHPNPAEAIGRVVRTRATARGARWLFHRGETHPARIIVRGEDETRTTVLQLQSSDGAEADVVRFDATTESGSALGGQTTFPLGEGTYVRSKATLDPGTRLPSFGQVRWVVPSSLSPLHETYSDAVRQGRRGAAKSIIRAVVPGLDDLESLVEDGQLALYVVFEDHSVPVPLLGDGIRTLAHLALELAARPEGTTLVEEPEVHQHPGAIRQSAHAILEATRRDIQVLLSTHSLDLIDALLAEATAVDRSRLAFYRFRLEEGRLVTSRIPGDDALAARVRIGEDLR